MNTIFSLALSNIPTSTFILIGVCAFSAIAMFCSLLFAKKKSKKILYSILSLAFALGVTYVTVFPVFINESKSEISYSKDVFSLENDLKIEVNRSFYPEKATKFTVKNENGDIITSMVVKDDSDDFDKIYTDSTVIQGKGRSVSGKAIKLNWCIIYEDENGEICGVNCNDYETKCEFDPYFNTIYQNMTP